MKKIILILIGAISFFSCKTETPEVEETPEKVKEVIIEEPLAKRFLAVDNEDTDQPSETKWIKIRYADVIIAIEAMDMGWDSMFRTKNDSLYKTDSDTAYFDLWPGDWFFDKLFKIENPEYDKIELYEKNISHFALNSNRIIEVPFCVLSNWKEFETDWARIQFTDNEYKFNSSEDETEIDTEFDINEFKVAIKDNCDDKWFEEFKNVQTKKGLRSEIFTSQYIFRIIMRNSKTGKSIKKFIVFNTPTSC